MSEPSWTDLLVIPFTLHGGTGGGRRGGAGMRRLDPARQHPPGPRLPEASAKVAGTLDRGDAV